MSGLRLSWFGIGLGLLAAAVAGPVLVIALIRGFDGLYGQDAVAYADYALGPLRGAILAGHVLPGFPLPPGYPLLVALASMAFGQSDVVARAVSLVAGASIPVFVALLAREIAPRRGERQALLAGLVAAVAGQVWQSSLVTMSDTPAAAAATLGAWAACRFHQTGSRRWLALAAGALGLAIETRLVYGVVAVVFGVLALARLRADAQLAPRPALTGAALAFAAGLAVLAPTILAIGAALVAGRPAPFGVEFGVAAFDPLTPLRSTFETIDGHLAYAWPMAAWYALQPVHWYWLGPIGLAVPIGLMTVLRSPGRSLTRTAVLIAWPAAVFVVLMLYPFQNPRFFMAMLPPIAILAAAGLVRTWEVMTDRLPGTRAIGLAVAVLAFGTSAGLAWRYTDGFATRQVADLAVIRTLEAEIPAGSPVASIGATPVLRHDGRQVMELFNLPERATRELLSKGSFYVLVNASSMRTQWAGTPTGRAYELLRGAPGFVIVERTGAWTLFRAGTWSGSLSSTPIR